MAEFYLVLILELSLEEELLLLEMRSLIEGILPCRLLAEMCLVLILELSLEEEFLLLVRWSLNGGILPRFDSRATI